jgi:RNA polymerase sigma-70 factor (ECF subfamily)
MPLERSKALQFDSWKELLQWLPEANEGQLLTVFVWTGEQAKAPPDDAPLLAQVRREAFEQLVARTREPLKRFLVRRQGCHDVHLAEDVVQEVLIKVFRHAEQYDPQRSFWGWLYRIVRHQYIDSLRRQRPGDIGRGGESDAALEEWMQGRTVPAPRPEDAALEREQGQQLEEAIDRLPRLQQTIVRLRREGIAGKDIAQQIGKSQAYVSQSYHEAIEVIRDQLDQ